MQEVGRRTVEVEADTRIPARGVGKHTAEEELGRDTPEEEVDSIRPVVEECSTSRAKGTYALLAALERNNTT